MNKKNDTASNNQPTNEVQSSANPDETGKPLADKNDFKNYIKCEYGKEYKYDLNGDGTEETIKFDRIEKVIKASIGDIRYTVSATINNAKKDYSDTAFYGLEEYYFITDLDKKDNFKEICIVEAGPSDDPMTTVLTYNNDAIVECGELESYPDKFKYNEDGTFEGKIRLGLFQTWWANQIYSFDDNHKVITKQMDKYVPDKIDLTLLKTCKFYSQKDTKSELITVNPQKCYCDKTDDKSWCHIVFEDGTSGCITLTGMSSVNMPGTNDSQDLSEIFEGRVLAD